MSKYHVFRDAPTKENVNVPDVGNNYEEDKGCFQRDLFAAKKRNIWSCIKPKYYSLDSPLFIPFIGSCSLKTIEVFSEGCIVDLGREIIYGVLLFQAGNH